MGAKGEGGGGTIPPPGEDGVLNHQTSGPSVRKRIILAYRPAIVLAIVAAKSRQPGSKNDHERHSKMLIPSSHHGDRNGRIKATVYILLKTWKQGHYRA